MKKPLILVVNDDGIFAPGIKALVEVASSLGEVLVVAPNSPQSGMGHAITIHDPLRLRATKTFGDHIESYECSGTPVDCVKLAHHVVAKKQGRQIDLCVSGINHGSNASLNIIYSGTMSAAMEAALEGIPAIGFSLLNFSWEADFEPSKFFVRQICEFMLEQSLEKTKLLNVNIPKLPLAKIKGMRISRQAKGHWIEEFVENNDPSGKPYYWMTGKFQLEDTGTDTDIWALENGYVSIVPSYHDLTHYEAIAELTAHAHFPQSAND
jgi:5'-nucleotidase